MEPDKAQGASTPGAIRSDATRTHIRGSSLLLIGRLIALGLNFAVQVSIVRYLSKTDFGAFAYALSIVSMGSSVALFGLDKAVGRFIPIYDEQHDESRVCGTILLTAGTIVGIGLAMVLMAYGFQGLFSRHVVNDPHSVSVLLIVIALAPLQALGNWFQAMFAVFASSRAIFFRRHVLTPGLRLAAVLLVILTQSNVYALAYGYLIGGLIAVSITAVMLWQLLHRQGVTHGFSLSRITMPVREIFSFSVPLLTTDLVLILKSSIVVLLLEFFHGTTEVAAFRAVVPIAGLNLVVMQSFKYLFTPLAARLFARNDKAGINDLYWRTATWIAVMSFPVFAISFSFATPLTVLLFGERYAQSGIILSLLALGNYFNAALGFNAYTLRVYDKVRYIVTIDMVSAIFSLGGNLWLIPRYGAVGAAIGTCATLVMYNVLKHVGLVLGTDIDLFQWHYLKVYLGIALGASGLLLIHLTLVPPLYSSVVLVALVSLLLIRCNRAALDVGAMFPEVKRIPLLRLLCKP